MVQREYNEETKAAVIAALLQGQSINSVAKQYEIPRATIYGWRDAAGLSDPTLSHSKKAEIGTKVIAYLEASLETLRVQAEFFRDQSWARKQDASQLAVLHGVLTDKAIRLLEALTTTADEVDTTPD